MSAKRSLDELKALSKNALHSAELVEIARTHAPTSAYDLAIQRGRSRRLATATRYLAMVVRDYGPKAFDAFVPSHEHARSDSSGAQHARENMHMELDDADNRLFEMLGTPREKLAFLLRKMHTSATHCYFHQLIQRHDVWIQRSKMDTFTLFLPASEAGKKELEPRPIIVIAEKNNHDNVVAMIDFAGYVAFVNQTPHGTETFVRELLTRSIAHPPTMEGAYRIAEGITDVARERWPCDDELRKKCESWAIEFFFHLGNITILCDFVRKAMGKQQEDVEPRNLLDDVISFWRNYGSGNQKLAQLCQQWLRSPAATNADSVLAVASALSRIGRRTMLTGAFDVCFPKLWGDIISSPYASQNLRWFKQLLELGMAPEEGFFGSEMVRLLSLGLAGQVFDLISRYKLPVSQYSTAHTKVRVIMEELAPAAFDLAYKEGRYGVAAALTQHFACEKKGENDPRITTVLQDAIALEQPIALNFMVFNGEIHH